MNSLHTAQILKRHIDAQPPKVYESWRCSSLGGCPREHYFKRLGVEETQPKDDRTRRKFLAGDWFHEFIQELTIQEVEKMGGVAVKEKELYDEELDLGGRYDLLIEADDTRILKDYKTQHSGFFHKLERAAKVLMSPDKDIYAAGRVWRDAEPEQRQEYTKKALWSEYPHMVKQLAGYMLLLKRAGTPVDEGIIVRVSKDDLSLAEVHFELTPELEKLVLEEVEMLNAHWREKTLPPCICPTLYDGKAVEWCVYGDGKRCCNENLASKLIKEK